MVKELIKLLYNTTYKDNKIIQQINDLVGKPFNLWEAFKLKGVGSKRMIIDEVSPNLQAIVNRISDVNYGSLELRPKGVLIHINPERLLDVYKRLYKFSDEYICIAEYYNPSPVTIPYRGHNNKLFKRDFAGELMSIYPDLQLIDYGFSYHKDPVFPQDDITWFLMKKTI